MDPFVVKVVAAILLLATSEISAAKLGDDPNVKFFAETNNEFSTDLFLTISKSHFNENLFFAPYSINIALGMTHLGAVGETAKQIENVLRWNSTKAPLSGYKKYISALYNQAANNETDYILVSAQRAYVDSSLTLNTNFTEKAKKIFKVDVVSADFANDTENQRVRINEWVASQTRDKILETLSKGSIHDRTTLDLFDVFYFKGNWLFSFDSKQTSDDFFYAPEGNVTVPMMKQLQKIKYVHNDDLRFSAVELPYVKVNGSDEYDLSMLLLLPDKNQTLEQLTPKLTAEELPALLKSLHTKMVNVTLPRFNISSHLDLKKYLIELGLDLLFSDHAELSGFIVEDKPLSVSDIVHEAVLEVNDEGTVAAAATEIEISPTSPEEVVTFHASRPFIIYLVDRHVDTFLGMGHVYKPAP